MASIASRIAVTTFCFFSLNFSNKAGTHAGAYVEKRFFKPFAKPAKQRPAIETTTTLLSFWTTCEKITNLKYVCFYKVFQNNGAIL